MTRKTEAEMEFCSGGGYSALQPYSCLLSSYNPVLNRSSQGLTLFFVSKILRVFFKALSSGLWKMTCFCVPSPHPYLKAHHFLAVMKAENNGKELTSRTSAKPPTKYPTIPF